MICPDTEFNVALIEARTELGLTRKQAAEKTGFTVGFVASYEECAKNPTMRTIFLFARAYGLSVAIDGTGITIRDRLGNDLLRAWHPDGSVNDPFPNWNGGHIPGICPPGR